MVGVWIYFMRNMHAARRKTEEQPIA